MSNEITRRTQRKQMAERRDRNKHESLFNFQCPKHWRDIQAKASMELHGGVAQLGEHLPCKQGVKGSNPFISTTAKKGKGPKPRELGRIK